MIETRGIWTDLIGGVGLEIAEVFNQAQEEYIPGIGNVLQVNSGVTGQKENFTGKTGVGELQRFDEGDDLPGGRRYKTYTTEVAWNDYGKFIDVTKQAIEDRDFQAELAEMKDLSIGANFSQDKSGMQIFNDGFSGTGTTDVNGYRITGYGDAEQTFSTVHPSTVPGQGTQSNANANGDTLTHPNLETGLVNLVEQQTDDGLPMALLGKPMLVLPPALRKEALEITESQLDPTTANNAINVYRNGMDTDMAVSTHLSGTFSGSNTAWFLVVPGRTRFVHFVRQQPRLEQEVNIKNKVVTFTVDARWADAILDWKRSYGSKGDGASYSD